MNLEDVASLEDCHSRARYNYGENTDYESFAEYLVQAGWIPPSGSGR